MSGPTPGNAGAAPFRVLDTTGRSAYPPEALAEIAGLPVRFDAAVRVEPEELLAHAQEAEVLMVTAAHITREVIEGLPRLRGVVRYGIGLDRIDVGAAAEHGVCVRNTLGFCTDEMADHTLALVLACARDLLADARCVRGGGWSRGGRRPLHRLGGGTAGVIGFGAIGAAVARRLQALGMQVLAFDPYADVGAAVQAGVHMIALDDLLARADVITVHCPLTPETRGCLGRARLARCKPGAILVNTARGGILDEAALIEALEDGRIAAAGLDVLDPEPPEAGHPLRRMDNVVLTPHSAWYSEEAEVDLVVGAFRALADILRAG